MSSHTLGPWSAGVQDRVLTGPHKEQHANWYVLGEDGTEDGVLVATLDASFTGSATEANALLIAAAPELLEVVRGVLGLERRKLLKDKGARAWIGAAEAVLAKVEGR